MSDLVRAFRRNAVHIRQGLSLLGQDSGRVQVEGGYLQDEHLIDRYKRLSIPVRRALNPNDRASFTQTLTELSETAGADRQALASVRAAWQRLQQELDSPVGLGGSRLPRRDILSAWLEAAAFYDKLERDRAYDRVVDRWGKAAEGIAAPLMEEAARVILQLDEAAAEALDEPVILPPPQKTPPPPKDRKERWWRKLLG